MVVLLKRESLSERGKREIQRRLESEKSVCRSSMLDWDGGEVQARVTRPWKWLNTNHHFARTVFYFACRIDIAERTNIDALLRLSPLIFNVP